MSEGNRAPLRRRDLLALIGAASGGATMYQAMTTLGFAAESPYTGPIRLDGDPRGASVVVLGAGLAGLVAAIELKRAGYRVQVLESEARAGGRCWTIRGGDRITDIDGAEPDLRVRPRPVFQSRAMAHSLSPQGDPRLLQAVRRSPRTLHPGEPQRLCARARRFWRQAAALPPRADRISTATSPSCSPRRRTRTGSTMRSPPKTRQRLLEALQLWGGLDDNYRYVKGEYSSEHRGYDKDPGGGLSGAPVYSQPIGLSDVLRAGLWQDFGSRSEYNYQMTMFQPVGGMDMIARALARELDGVIRFGSKVTAVRQDASGVTRGVRGCEAAGPHPDRARRLVPVHDPAPRALADRAECRPRRCRQRSRPCATPRR